MANSCDAHISLSAMLSNSLSNDISVSSDTEADRMMKVADWSSRGNPIRLCCCCGDGASDRCWKDSPTVIAIVLLWWRWKNSEVILLCGASCLTEVKYSNYTTLKRVFFLPNLSNLSAAGQIIEQGFPNFRTQKRGLINLL